MNKVIKLGTVGVGSLPTKPFDRQRRATVFCMIIERWSKPVAGWHGCSQEQAYQVARDSKKWRESQRPTKDTEE